MKYAPLLIITVFSTLYSCNNNSESEVVDTEKLEADATSEEKKRFQRAKIVMFSIPSPVETTRMLKKSGVNYDRSILNTAQNVAKYQTTPQMSVALGLYVSDLSFANAYDQQQDCLDYFKAIRTLAGGLALEEIFTQDFVSKVEQNISKPDSILIYLSQAYWQANESLKESEREHAAALVATGGWIEGLWIATRLQQKPQFKAIMGDRIAEQKGALKQLIAYVESFEHLDLQKHLTDLKELEALFNQVEEKTEKVAPSNEGGVAVVGKRVVYSYPPDLLKKISETTARIRNSYVG